MSDCEHDYTVKHIEAEDITKANRVTLACLRCGHEQTRFTAKTREQIETEITKKTSA